MCKLFKVLAIALALCGLCAPVAFAADYAVQGNMIPDTFSAGKTFTGQLIKTPVATQVIGAGGTIAADSCGGLKLISAAGAVTTDTTNSFTAPSAALAGCCMTVFNAGDTNSVTIDGNTLTVVVGSAANLAVTAYDAVNFCCDGTTWRQTTALLSNN
jgi:hypothetical protein